MLVKVVERIAILVVSLLLLTVAARSPQISGANDPSVGLHEPIDSEPEANNRVYSQSVCCNEQREGTSLELPFTRGNNRTLGTHLLITGSIH